MRAGRAGRAGRASRAVLGVTSLGAIAACHPSPAAGGSATAVSAAPVAPAASEAAAADPWRGRDLSDLLVPLLTGGELPLKEMAGRGVVLRVVAPGAPASADALTWAREVAAASGVTVVLVSLEPDELEVGARWGPIPPPGVRLGWDPQGAFAARLGVSRLPLVLILDGVGVVREAWEGEAPAAATLGDADVTRGPTPPEAGRGAGRG